MKTSKGIILGIVLAATAFLTTGDNLAFGYDVTVKNTTAENVKVILYTRSDYSWDKFPHAFSNFILLNASGGTHTFSVPVDYNHACPSYLGGYDEGFKKPIAMIGCDGVEVDNSSSRCCANSSFEVYKKTDGTLHFRIK